jgi:hypothetical protein
LDPAAEVRLPIKLPDIKTFEHSVKRKFWGGEDIAKDTDLDEDEPQGRSARQRPTEKGLLSR